jgi:HEAT repeat protein
VGAGFWRRRVIPRAMTDLPPLKTSCSRRLQITTVAGLTLAAILYWMFGPESKSGSVERRVTRLLNEQRRQEFQNSAPLWIQRWMWQVTRHFQNDYRTSTSEELAALGPKAIPALSRALLKDPSPAIRSLAARVLGELGEIEAVPALTNALALDPDESVAVAASGALAGIGDASALPGLISAFKVRTNDYVRVEMAQQLAAFHDPQVVQMLATALAHETNYSVRAGAAQALGEIGAESTFTNLVTAVTTDAMADVRTSAATALRKLKTSQAVPVLLRQMRSDGSADVRAAAAAALLNQESAEIVAEFASAMAQEKDERVRGSIISSLGSMTNEAAVAALMLAATNDPSTTVKMDAMHELVTIVGRRPINDLLSLLRAEPPEESRGAAAIELADDLRDAAAAALAESHHSELLPVLIEFLRTNNSTTAMTAVAPLLSVRGVPQVFPILLDRLTNSKTDAQTRQYSIRALGALANPAAIPPLMNSLTNDLQTSVRTEAAMALGALGARAALPVLTNLVVTETNTPLRSLCLSVLGTLQDTRAVPVLLMCLSRKNDSALREGACEALGEIGAALALPALARLARDEKLWPVRCAAIRSVGQIGGPEAVAALLSCLARSNGRQAEEQVAILSACGQTGDPSVAPALIGKLQDDDQRVVVAAAEALGNLGATNAVPDLIHLATTGSREVRAQAAKALGQIGDSQAVPELIEMLKKDRYSSARTKAAEALAIMCSMSSVPALREALADPDDEVRTEVICSLGHLGDTNCAASVIRLLNDKVRLSNVRFDSCYYLVEMGGSDGIGALLDRLHDNDPDTSLPAALALAMMGQTNGMEVMRAFLNHTVPWCRLASLVSLAQYHTPEAADLLRLKTADESATIAHVAQAALSGNLTPALVDALADKDIRVRRAAVLMFLFFNDPAAIPALRKACSDRDSEIRDTARWAGRRLERMNRPPPPM